MDAILNYWRRFAVSDDKYVNRIRRKVSFHQRWRWLLVGFFSSLAVLVLGMWIIGVNLVANVARMANAANAPGPWSGFAVGALMVIPLGAFAIWVALGLFASLSNLRTERLMLKYHDAIEELARAKGADRTS